jgi:hypothetical protein
MWQEETAGVITYLNMRYGPHSRQTYYFTWLRCLVILLPDGDQSGIQFGHTAVLSRLYDLPLQFHHRTMACSPHSKILCLQEVPHLYATMHNSEQNLRCREYHKLFTDDVFGLSAQFIYHRMIWWDDMFGKLESVGGSNCGIFKERGFETTPDHQRRASFSSSTKNCVVKK